MGFLKTGIRTRSVAADCNQSPMATCDTLSKTRYSRITTRVTIDTHRVRMLSFFIVEHLGHVNPLQLVAKTPVVVPSADTGNDRNLPAAVLFSSDTFSLLHQERPDTLMLEHLGVTTVNLDRGSIYMLRRGKHLRLLVAIPNLEETSSTYQFPNDTASSIDARQFLAERPFLRAFSQTEQADQDVLFGVLVRQESLPPAVRAVVPAQELERLWSYTLMNLGHLSGDPRQ